MDRQILLFVSVILPEFVAMVTSLQRVTGGSPEYARSARHPPTPMGPEMVVCRHHVSHRLHGDAVFSLHFQDKAAGRGKQPKVADDP